MKIEEAIASLRRVNQRVPKPMRLPTPEELTRAESDLRIQFHPDYRKYLLQASDVVFGTKEPCTVVFDGSHTDLVEITLAARKDMGLPVDLLPICEDNGDYYCMTKTGQVVFWSHQGQSSEGWSDLAEWIQKVWIEEG